MPKDRAADGGWVDEWDEADEGPETGDRGPGTGVEGIGYGVEGLGAEGEGAADPTQDAVGSTQYAVEETEHGTRDTEQNLPWREVVRTAPPWIWLISSTALFGICAMFLAVMMLIAMGK